MLVHGKATPSIMIADTHLYTQVKRENVKKSFLSKETTRLKLPTFRTEGQHAKPLEHRASTIIILSHVFHTFSHMYCLKLLNY